MSPMDRAAELQRSVRMREDEQLSQGIDYSDHRVRMSSVHAREDIILICSMLEMAVTKLSTVIKLLVLISVILAYMALK